MTCTRCHKPSKAKVCHSCRGRMGGRRPVGDEKLMKLTVWVEPGLLLSLEEDVDEGRARSLGDAIWQRMCQKR